MSFVSDFAEVDNTTMFNEHMWGDGRIAMEDRKRREEERLRQEIECKKAEEERKRKHEEAQKRAKEAMDRYRKEHGDYWEYFGCYIPLERRAVPAKDKVNTVSMFIDSDGNVSQMETLVGRIGGSDYTQEEYRAKYCQERNGKYYFVCNPF